MSATLSEMATQITSEMGLYDEVSLSACKWYLNRRYLDLWDKYPWGDATGNGTGEAAFKIHTIDYPAGTDRIITLRAASGSTIEYPINMQNHRFLDPVDSTFLFETDPNLFYEEGYVKYYEEVGDAAHRQIRLYPIPNMLTALFFYGKMICPGLVADTDTAGLRNIDSVIMAYAHADMLKRQRQGGRSKLQIEEAEKLEAAAWALEQQQANQPRRTKATTVAGNSLAEMTDAVCTICGQWTPDYRLMIREFLRRNYQTMYDTYLWPESLVAVYVSYTGEQIIMPPYVDKVLGVQGANALRMFPAEAGLILDISPSTFQEIGDPISYTTLTPVAVNTLPDTTTQLRLASTSDLDRVKIQIRGELISTGQEFEEQIVLTGLTPVTTTYSYDIPITIAKDITLGDVTVNAATDMRLLVTLFPNVRELKHQRLWFLPAPNTDNLTAISPSFTCLVLAKRAIRPLITDEDTPIITGAQQVLIAAAAGDVFRKLEKSEQANAMLQKAGGATDVLKAKNTDQAASAPRFVPQVEPHAYASGGVGGCLW